MDKEISDGLAVSNPRPFVASTTDPEQSDLRARLEEFRKAKEAKQRAAQNLQKSVKYPAPFVVPKPDPVAPKLFSTHGFYDPEKQKKQPSTSASATRPWRSRKTGTTAVGSVKNPALAKRPLAVPPKPRSGVPAVPIKRKPVEATACVGRKSTAEPPKRNVVVSAGTRTRERAECSSGSLSKSTQTTPETVEQGDRERAVSDVRRDFRSAKSWKLRVVNPKTGFTVSDEYVPATYLYIFTIKDALSAAKRNDRDVARAIFEILYTEERRYAFESCKPIPVERAAYWMAWAKFEEEEGNHGKALNLLEEAIRRQKQPDEQLLNALINLMRRYEQSGNREPLQQIIPIGSGTGSESSTLHSRPATSSPEPRPFEVLEDPDSPMPSVPDFQSSIALELASWSPTRTTKKTTATKMENEPARPPSQPRDQADNDESSLEVPALGTPQSRLGSSFASFESTSSTTVSPLLRCKREEEDEDQSKTADITNILDGLDINDRRDETAARLGRTQNPQAKPKNMRFAADSSVKVLTPVRTTKKEKDLFGVTSVITPVRRSARHLPKETVVLEENGANVPKKSPKCTPKLKSRFSDKENGSIPDDVDATPNARKIAMQRRLGTAGKKFQEGTSNSDPCFATAPGEETGLLYKYGEVTPSKRVKSLLGCEVTLSAVRRSARNLNRPNAGARDEGFSNGSAIVVNSLEDLPKDIEYGYLPNPNIPMK